MKCFITVLLLCFSINALGDFDFKLYAGSFSNLPEFSKLNPVKVGKTPYISTLEAIDATNYALTFSNQLTVSTSADYEFRLNADDGAKLYIDGTNVVDHGGSHAPSYKSSRFFLNKGQHNLEVQYFQRGGRRALSLEYRVEGGIFRPVPADGMLDGAIPKKSQIGEWGEVINWPIVAVASANLPDGRIYTWTGDGPRSSFGSPSIGTIYNPENNTFQSVNNTFHALFCSGLNMLEDGSILATGGQPDSNKTSIFDPDTLTWTALSNMQDARYYGTAVTLPNNETFTTFARSAGNRSEKFNLDRNSWRPVSNASMQTFVDEQNSLNDQGAELQWYADLIVQPDGKVFNGGPTPTFHVFDPIGGGEAQILGKPAGNRARTWGNTVNYDVGKVLMVGGSDRGKASYVSNENTFLVDLNGPAPVVTSGAPTNYGRALSNAVVLPNGEVIVVGGEQEGQRYSESTSVYPAEIYNPESNKWTVVDAIEVPRNYHSTAILMKDGRVLAAGGGACKCSVDRLSAQIYSPPYLFNDDGSLASRPSLSGVPVKSGAANSFRVNASADTTKFVMMRLSAHTHHINTEQRFVPVESKALGGGEFVVTLNPNPNVLLPGNYWMFAINDQGTPSIGQTVQILRGYVDTDGDGVTDDQDAFPDDPKEWKDTDFDGTGDNADDTPNGEGELPANATQCAKENETCSLPTGMTATVWYGAGNTWYSRSNVTTSIGCDNAVFGDPLKGTKKACYYLDQNLDEVVTPIPSMPRQSTTLIVESSAGVDRIWNVNPDNNSVSVTSVDGQLIKEIPVGRKPWALAKSPSDNKVFVTNKSSATLVVIDTIKLTVSYTIGLEPNGQPHGIIFNKAGDAYYVAYEALAQVEKRSSKLHQVLAVTKLSGKPRHLSLAYDDSRLLVTNFITPILPGESTTTVDTSSARGEVFVLDPGNLSLDNTIGLAFDNRLVTESTGPGLPNYLNAPVITFDNQFAYVPSKKDNIDSGTARGKLGMSFDQTVRANISRIDLASEQESGQSIDFDNSSVATGGALTGEGRYLLTALETSRELAVYDTLNGYEVMRLPTGRAPQSVAISSDGSRAFVHNFMDRSVSLFDLTRMIQTGLPLSKPISTVKVVNTETLSDQVLKGKQLFYDAADDRLARDNYMSCASCHNEGSHDGRVWDLTGMGEGLRNTIDLRGRGGMQHGLLHWTGNFDEVQDFEGQIRQLAGGTGLMSNTDFNAGDTAEPLGTAKAGKSSDLDALAAYVGSLNTFAASPYRNGSDYTSAAVAGRQLFIENNCASCHGGANFTKSDNTANLEDIGTIKASSGSRLDEALTGFDVPTLRDVWQSAPYLHDGSAQTVADAINAHDGINLSDQALTELSAFVNQIGNGEPGGLSTGGDTSPVVTLNQPNASVGNATGSIEAIASDADGAIVSVAFYYNGDNLIERLTTAPYVLNWANVPDGTYNLTAKATDNDGLETTSNTVAVVVNNGLNIAPTVTLNPAQSSAGNVSGSITAVASDADGSISKVEFYYNGDNLLDTITQAPYTVNWAGAPDGTYELTARAYDDAGEVTTSNIVTIEVNNALE